MLNLKTQLNTCVLGNHSAAFLNKVYKVYNTGQMFGVRKSLFIKDSFNWSKVTVKTYCIHCYKRYLVQIIAVLLNFLFIKEFWFCSFHKKYKAAQLFSTLIIKINVSWAENQHISMISEGSYDTKDWSREEKVGNCNNISQYYCFTVFLIKKMNATLV